jgi:hypothetical protein
MLACAAATRRIFKVMDGRAKRSFNRRQCLASRHAFNGLSNNRTVFGAAEPSDRNHSLPKLSHQSQRKCNGAYDHENDGDTQPQWRVFPKMRPASVAKTKNPTLEVPG